MSKKQKKNKARKVDFFYTLTYDNGVVVKSGGKAKGTNGTYHVKTSPAMIHSTNATFGKVVRIGKQEKPCEELDGTLKVL